MGPITMAISTGTISGPKVLLKNGAPTVSLSPPITSRNSG